MAHIARVRAEEIAEKLALLAPTMDERQTRLWLAAEAKAIERGGIAAVTRAAGVLSATGTPSSLDEMRQNLRSAGQVDPRSESG